MWTVGGEPGALAASYLPERVATALGVLPAGKVGEDDVTLGGQERSGLIPPASFPFPWRPAGPDGPQPSAVQLEMGLPPPSAARTLRLSAGEPVATVTVSFTDAESGAPVALTMAMLRPELFRIVVEATPERVSANRAGGLASAWTHAGDGWDP